MRTNILRSVAMTLGICVCGTVQAQYGGYGSMPATPNQQFPSHQANHGQFVLPSAPPAAQQPYQPGAPLYVNSGQALAQAQHAFPPAQQPAYVQPNQFAGQVPNAVPVHPSLQRTPPANQWGPSVPQGSGFQPSPYRGVSDGGQLMAPVPAPSPVHQPIQGGQLGYGAAGHAPHGADPNCASCNGSNIYVDAASAPWDSGVIHSPHGPGIGCAPTVPIRNWFAGASLLFFDYEEDYNRRLVFPDAMPATTMLQTNQVDPGASLGFETYFGRYFACGKYAIVGSYFYFNPDRRDAMITAPMAGDYRAAFPTWDRMAIDRDNDGVLDNLGDPATAADDHLYGAYDAAAQYRVRRDIDIQGFELNFVAFGIGGASRAGMAGACGSGGCGPGLFNGVGQGGAACNPCYQTGCGGMGGPMVPACHSRMQFQVLHGIRWFQFRDQFEFAASMMPDGFGGGINDYFYNIDVRNDLLGYQFGGRADYCVTQRVNVYAGGKIGIYGNDVSYRSRIGTREVAAEVGPYYPSMEGDLIDVRRNQTVLSTLAELDLGVGIRLTNCWTLTGGYRLIGLTGIATSVGAIAEDPANVRNGHLNWVNDSFALQGGYVGLNYNW